MTMTKTATMSIEGIDTAQLEKFNEQYESAPKNFELGIECKTIWEQKGLGNLGKVGRWTLGGQAIEKPTRDFSVQLGSWKEVGGGLQLSTSGAFPLNKEALQRPDLMLKSPLRRPARVVNMSELGKVLTTMTDADPNSPPVKAVFGNTDAPDDPELAQEILMNVDGLSIHVSHGHEVGSPTPAKLATHYPADVVVYGHTHQQLVTTLDGRLFVNPGAAGPRRPPADAGGRPPWLPGCPPLPASRWRHGRRARRCRRRGWTPLGVHTPWPR